MQKNEKCKDELAAYLRHHDFAKEIEAAIASGKPCNEQLIREILESDPEVTDLFDRLALETTWEDANELIESAYIERDRDQLVGRLVKLSADNRKKAKLRIKRISVAVSAAVAAGFIFGFFMSRESVNENSNSVLVEAYSKYTAPTLILNQEDIVELHGNKKITPSDYACPATGAGGENDNPKDRMIAGQRLIVPCGCMSSILLDDGSEITLNAGSELTFPTRFDGHVREVTLKGEAYFKIAEYAGRPFIVRTDSRADVKVYGTSFSVNSRSGDSFNTLLVDGSVGVMIAGGGEVMLSPSQLISLDPGTGNYSLQTIDAKDYLGWMNNMFMYVERPVDEVLRDISIWYGVTIERPGRKFSDIKVTCSAKRDMELSEMLGFLGKMLNVKFTCTGGAVYKME